jgi:hypothetical protein
VKEKIMQTDYLPQSFAAFREWVRNFLTVARENKDEWGLPQAPLAAMERFFEDYHVIDDTASGPDATKSSRVRRREARKALSALIRTFVNKYVNPNDAVGDAERAMLGLRVRRRNNKPTGEPNDSPEFIIKITNIRVLAVHFWERGAFSKAKPAGVSGAIIRYAVLDAPPADLKCLTEALLATRTPQTLSFREEERGKTVYIALQWLTRTGKTGPFSEIKHTIVP